MGVQVRRRDFARHQHLEPRHGVFDMAQSVVAQASGIIGSDASIDISAVMTDMESRLMDMDLGPLFGLWFQSLFIGITMWRCISAFSS